MREQLESMAVAWPSIRRRLENNGGDGVYLLVKVPGTKGSPDELVADVERAMDRANSRLDRDGEEIVWAGAVMPSIKGPMVNLDWVGTDEQTQEWLDEFAAALEEAGRSGSVTAAPQANFSIPVQEYWLKTRLTAYLAFTLTEPLPQYSPPVWLVDDATTQSLCADAVAWGAYPGARVYLIEGVAQMIVESPDVSAALATGVRRSTSAEVTYLGKDPVRNRSVTLEPRGQVVYQAGRDGGHWSEHVDAVRHPLLRAPEALDLAFVRPRMGFGSWQHLAGDPNPLPYVTESLVRLNRHLWDSYVPDANAIQVITRAHLDKATDLSGWDVQPLAGDRYLVQARDLGPWFEPEVPDQRVLDQARTDFGAMILTRDVIQADPDGWVPGRTIRSAK